MSMILPQEKHEEKTHRIARNSVLLFVRMFILMIVNMWAVRFILNGLGTEDYGLLNTVIGVITTATFICSITAVSIQRFYSVSLGENDSKKFAQVYSISINISVIGCLLCLLLFETIGLWFVYKELTIPIEKLTSVLWVYQFGMLTFCCSLLQIPFTAAIFAKEDMGVYSVISTIECVGKLIVSYLISFSTIDNLIFYSGGLFIISVLITTAYIISCKRKYKECRYIKKLPNPLYRNILSFSGWTAFGSLANTGITQGSIILINIFFGPITNAAFGIAQQINNAFSSFSNAMILPFRPAMIKAYTEGRREYVMRLLMINSKFILFALLSIAIPIVTEMKDILQLWLAQSTGEMVVFSRLIIIYIIIMMMNNPITIIFYAAGKIKKYNLIVEGIMLLCFPTTWLLFLVGMPAYSVFFSMIGYIFFVHFIRLFLLKEIFPNFSILKYITILSLPSLGIIVSCFLAQYLISIFSFDTNMRIFMCCILIPLLGISIAFLIGLDKNEQKEIISFVRTKILHQL